MPVLEVRNIKKTFEGNEVLKGIDFSMEKGEVLSIIGSSGSGKTTLLRCLNFLETPDTGEILVDGETVFSANDTRKLTPAERQNRQLRFGMVFQSFNLFPQYSVKKNLTLAAALREKRLLRESGAPADQVKAALTEIDRRAEELLATVGFRTRPMFFRPSFRAVSSSGWQSRARSCFLPKFSALMSPPRRWIPN